MNGVYKIYDKEKGTWVEMPMYFKGDKGESGDSTVVPGSVEKSAILEGLNNKAISEASSALGEDSTAGLKGWYYTSIELDKSNNTHIITLSDTQPTVNNGELVGTWTSGTVNVKSGDKISIVNNSKFDFCGEVTGYKNNKIRVKGLQFDTIEIPETISRDDFSIYLPEKPDAGIIDFGHGAFSQGVNTKSSNLASHAEGSGTHAYGQYSHTEGRETKAGYGAHAEGRETVASGNLSHAEGRESVASGTHSHAEGRKTIASNLQSHAEGYKTQATGSNSHTEGYETEASGIASHAEGYKSQAKGGGSHAEGGYYINSKDYYAGGIASGNASHAEGVGTTASGMDSHAEGYKTEASNNHAHAEGNLTRATGGASHAEGRETEASGNYSHAEGRETKALGQYSHTSGHGTVANNEAEFACGKYNNSQEDTLFSIGNGTKESNRKNALEVKKNGDVYILIDGVPTKLQDLLK